METCLNTKGLTDEQFQKEIFNEINLWRFFGDVKTFDVKIFDEKFFDENFIAE